MSYASAMEYFNMITPLTAEESQRAVMASSFPHLKKEKAKKITKDLQKAARPKFEQKAPESTEDLYQHLLRTLGNG